MPEFHKLMLFAGAGIGAFALLLLIISVATPAWADDGNGNTIGLFRQCFSNNANSYEQGQVVLELIVLLKVACPFSAFYYLYLLFLRQSRPHLQEIHCFYWPP